MLRPESAAMLTAGDQTRRRNHNVPPDECLRDFSRPADKRLR